MIRFAPSVQLLFHWSKGILNIFAWNHSKHVVIPFHFYKYFDISKNNILFNVSQYNIYFRVLLYIICTYKIIRMTVSFEAIPPTLRNERNDQISKLELFMTNIRKYGTYVRRWISCQTIPQVQDTYKFYETWIIRPNFIIKYVWKKWVS